KALEALGILEVRAGAGLYVRDFSFEPILNNLGYGLLFDLKQLYDIIEVRSHIDYGMVPRILQAVTPGQLKRLHEVLGRMRQAAEAGRFSPEDDRALHQILYENVDNLVVGKLLDICWEVFFQAKKRGPVPEIRDPMASYRSHAALVEALEKGDEEAMR